MRRGKEEKAKRVIGFPRKVTTRAFVVADLTFEPGGLEDKHKRGRERSVCERISQASHRIDRKLS